MNESLTMGIALGVLIGSVTGIMSLLYLRDAFQRPTGRWSLWEKAFGRRGAMGVRFAAKFAALPSFWFGGPWLSTVLLKHAPLEELVATYMMSLAGVYTAIIIVPVVSLIVKIVGLVK